MFSARFRPGAALPRPRSGLFNSLYVDAAVKQLAADGFPTTDELLARLSPLQYDHINLLGRYAFTRPAAPELRQLRDPHTDEDDDDYGQE